MEQELELQLEVAQFLYHEAELLDGNSFPEWLDLMTEDISYEMPVRLTRQGSNVPDTSSEMGHFSENRRTLELRVKRLEGNFAWAQNPPSRTRRFISNVRIEPTSSPSEVMARSYFLLYRSRGSSTQVELVSGERRDLLRRVNGKWKLAKRLILVDQSTLGTRNLAIFL